MSKITKFPQMPNQSNMGTFDFPTFKYYFSFKLASSSSAKDGFPLSGYVFAESIEQATIKAKNIADKVCNSAWFNSKGVAFETLFGREVRLSQSVSVVDMYVTTTKIVDDWGDCHNDALRDIINTIWSMPMYAEKLEKIMSAYWERDKDELSNYFSDECYWWSANEKSFEEVCNDGMYEEMCRELFSHIFDDADYKAIINYIRPRNISGWDIAL